MNKSRILSTHIEQLQDEIECLQSILIEGIEDATEVKKELTSTYEDIRIITCKYNKVERLEVTIEASK